MEQTRTKPILLPQSNRFLRSQFYLSRAALYGLLSLMIICGYALLVGGLSLLLNWAANPPSAWVMGMIFCAVALAVNPLKTRLEQRINALLMRGQKAYVERLEAFSGDLTDVVSADAIVLKLRETLSATLQPSLLQIFLYDPLTDQYTARHEPGKGSDLSFGSTSALVSALGQRRSPVRVSELEAAPGVKPERNRLLLLGAELLAPLNGRTRLQGWCAIAARQDGEPYSNRELAFLDSICDQSSLAIERAHVVMNLENRMRETAALSRVAQGVNITLTLDDMLELIYAQTMQVIPAEDCHLALIDKENGELVEVFFVEGGERLSEREGKTALDQPLEGEVVRQRKPILAADYARECQSRGFLSARNNLFAWMGVPLNEGAQTIGALSLGRSDPTSAFTREQLLLLQSIADQAAGAIIKMRLLDETEERARQLSALNEVTQQLTSTLELEPLLQKILLSATDLLDCEAGSLLLVDEQSGELVFQATSGPVAEDFLHKRLPPGTGVVGKAVTTRQPVIVNDVQKSSDWFQKPDQQTGFTTRAMLAVPLMVEGEVTGVIEVINKKDGSPFSQDDVNLVSTFAGQASVAVKNARLFTMTDQALSARVEELSVMQRIDRELNTGLDVKVVMQITLEWAMLQVNTQAGWVGIVQGEQVRVMAAQGFTGELDGYGDGLMPASEFGLQQVIESGVPRRALLGEGEKGLLGGAKYQVVQPIRRETTTVGLLFLESQSQEAVSEEALAFLERLADHAAVAISNAQLYAAVQSANVAKSEFVSFVAHELKNPMTSIKGFTELLAAGAVGSVNDAQANFLQTIRSNIERMNTLVSDLNDLSKIEAGRLRLEFKSFPLSAVVDDAVRSLKRQIDEKGQKLGGQLPADLPPVWADRMRVSQVVINLVSNATKYTGQGGDIFIGAEACENRWDEKGARQVVHFWVQDTGIGISPEDQKKIFQKFFRADDPKTREVTGTGLGLNITRALVEMQGGKIWFESEFRKGTTFHFTLPVAEA